VAQRGKNTENKDSLKEGKTYAKVLKKLSGRQRELYFFLRHKLSELGGKKDEGDRRRPLKWSKFLCFVEKKIVGQFGVPGGPKGDTKQENVLSPQSKMNKNFRCLMNGVVPDEGPWKKN